MKGQNHSVKGRAGCPFFEFLNAHSEYIKGLLEVV